MIRAAHCPRVRNEEVIRAFLSGFPAKSHNENLRTDGYDLVNYSTVIAIRDGNEVILNRRKYSVTTSRIQNMVRRLAQEMGFTVKEVDGEPREAAF